MHWDQIEWDKKFQAVKNYIVGNKKNRFDDIE